MKAMDDISQAGRSRSPMGDTTDPQSQAVHHRLKRDAGNDTVILYKFFLQAVHQR